MAVRMAVLFDLLARARGARPSCDAPGDRRRADRRPGRASARGRRAWSTAAASSPSAEDVATADGDTVLDAARLRGRPGLRRPPRPPARAGPRGGRDDRDRAPGRRARRLHGGRGDAQHRSAGRTPRGVVEIVRALGERGRRCATSTRRLHHRRARRRAAGAVWPSWPAPACGCSPTTAPACRTRCSCAGRWSTRRASTWCSPSTARSRRSPRGAVMHEGRCCSDLGLPGWPADGRGADGPPRHRAGPAHRRPHPPAAPVDGAAASSWCGAAKADGLPVTAEATPHHLSLTDDALRGFDPVFKVNPPLRTDADVDALVKAGLADGTIDAIATDHAPHPAATRSGRSTRRRRGCSGWRRRSACACRCCTEPGCRSSRSSPRCRGSRRRSPGRRPPRTPDRRGRAGQPRRVRPDGGWEVVPARAGAAAATTRRSSAGSCTAGSATPSCTASPTVVDGVATDE